MRGPETNRIKGMFDNIAGDYDKLNHLFSLGIDKRWRQKALKWIVKPESRQEILDIACGTGDFSIAIAKKATPDSTVTGLDLSEGMLAVMTQKVEKAKLDNVIRIEQGNSEQMRFADSTFDCVTIAFGIRNFENRETALKEILRVLKPDGRLVILELSIPSNKVIRWFYNLYFTKLMPCIGGLISGDKNAYKYLPASVLAFPGKDEWMKTMSNCGYRNVIHKAFSLGICRMYIGEK